MAEWMQKMWYVHTTDYYLAFKRNEECQYVLQQMNLEGVVLSNRQT